MLSLLSSSDGGLPDPIIRSASASGVFEACSAFTRVPACVLARSPKVSLSEGFDRFVTSTTAPAATDWSDQFVGWELHPLRIGALARRTIGHRQKRS
jgi:hypothetical protein